MNTHRKTVGHPAIFLVDCTPNYQFWKKVTVIELEWISSVYIGNRKRSTNITLSSNVTQLINRCNSIMHVMPWKIFVEPLEPKNITYNFLYCNWCNNVLCEKEVQGRYKIAIFALVRTLKKKERNSIKRWLLYQSKELCKYVLNFRNLCRFLTNFCASSLCALRLRKIPVTLQLHVHACNYSFHMIICQICTNVMHHGVQYNYVLLVSLTPVNPNWTS